jgi:putative phage-type endonuclease
MNNAARNLSVVPFDVIADSRDRENWLKARRTVHTVGASEVACVLGISPFQSAYMLACVKTGRLPPEDLSDSERVFWGNQLEDAIVAGYSGRTGRVAVPFGLTLRSRVHPWMTATPDAFVSERSSLMDASRMRKILRELRDAFGASSSACSDLAAEFHDNVINCGWHPLQVKNIGFGSAEHWVEGVPDYYAAQCRAEAIVCGVQRCTGAALVAGQRLVWDDVDRTELTDRQIVNLTRSFVHECEAGRLPPVDGSESTTGAIKALYPREDPETFAQLGAEWFDHMGDLERMKADRKELDGKISTIENALKAEIGNAPRGILPDGSGWSYRTQKRAASTVAASEFRVLRRMKGKASE